MCSNYENPFHDSYESNIRALETLGVQTDSYGLLITVLLSKLPEHLRCTLLRTNPEADCSLNDLRTALCHEIDAREKSQLTQAPAHGIFAESMIKVLGLNWNTKTDTLSLSRKPTQQHRQNLQKISIKLFLKTIEPLPISGTSDRKAKIMI